MKGISHLIFFTKTTLRKARFTEPSENAYKLFIFTGRSKKHPQTSLKCIMGNFHLN